MFVPRARHAHRSDLADIYFVRQSRTRSSSQEKMMEENQKNPGWNEWSIRFVFLSFARWNFKSKGKNNPLIVRNSEWFVRYWRTFVFLANDLSDHAQKMSRQLIMSTLTLTIWFVRYWIATVSLMGCRPQFSWVALHLDVKFPYRLLPPNQYKPFRVEGSSWILEMFQWILWNQTKELSNECMRGFTII